MYSFYMHRIPGLPQFFVFLCFCIHPLRPYCHLSTHTCTHTHTHTHTCTTRTHTHTHLLQSLSLSLSLSLPELQTHSSTATDSAASPTVPKDTSSSPHTVSTVLMTQPLLCQWIGIQLLFLLCKHSDCDMINLLHSVAFPPLPWLPVVPLFQTKQTSYDTPTHAVGSCKYSQLCLWGLKYMCVLDLGYC